MYEVDLLRDRDVEEKLGILDGAGEEAGVEAGDEGGEGGGGEEVGGGGGAGETGAVAAVDYALGAPL